MVDPEGKTLKVSIMLLHLFFYKLHTNLKGCILRQLQPPADELNFKHDSLGSL